MLRAYRHGLDVLGMVDLGAVARTMNKVKPVRVSDARAMLKYGQRAIQSAIEAGQKLPGTTDRDEVLWKLKWHEDALAKEKSDTNIYGAGDDLKKWVTQAFIEGNAVEEGTAYRQKLWDAMVNEIEARAASVAEVPGKALDTALTIPWWVYAGGAFALGAVGIGAFSFAQGRR